MDKAITSALLITISMIMVVMLFNVAYPAIIEGGDTISKMTSRSQDRMSTQVSIVHAASELDSLGNWNDTQTLGHFEVFVWVKNIGSSRIPAVDRLDVFFGPEGNYVRVPHQSETGGAMPYWTWQIENDTEWKPTATLKITLHYPAALASGRYFLKVSTPVGVADDYFLGL